MNVRRASALLFAASLAFAGLYVPTQATLVNQAKAIDVDLKTNGLLVHVCDSAFNVGIQVDLKRIKDEEKFRIVLDPRLSAPPRPGENPRLPTRVVLQQLPPGTYVATKITLGDKDPVSFKPDTFEIRPGRATSWGKIRVEPQLDFLGFMTELDVTTLPDSIGPQIRAVRAYGIDTLPIDLHPVKWAIGKDEKAMPSKKDTGKGRKSGGTVIFGGDD